jgi:hypothetical protein
MSLILIIFLMVSTFLACKLLENNARTVEFLNSDSHADEKSIEKQGKNI